MFIIFLPIMLMSFALIIDIGLEYNAKIKGTELLNTALEENLDIEEYFKINDINIKNIKETKNCTTIKYEINSIFGSLIGYKTYDIKISNC